MEMEMEDVVIVSRHAGQVEWLKTRKGITGPVISHVEDPEEIAGKIVVGNVPLYLAAKAFMVVTVDMPGLSASQRGKDLSPEEMDAAGAHLSCYSVWACGHRVEEALDEIWSNNWTHRTGNEERR